MDNEVQVELPNKLRSGKSISLEKVIEVKHLTKSYNNKIILDNVSLYLHRGEALGILGPNGAGKTTLLETIEGLREIERGNIQVLGLDLKNNSKKIQNKIGIQLQKTSLFDKLTVKENLNLFIKLYGQKHRPEILLEDVNLLGQKDLYVRNLSGGQFQRLKLCLSLINSPEILFLDEPTTGLDPAARKVIWDKINNLIAKGTSVVLTTHYMEEAESICDRIAILYKGQFIANDKPANLVKKLGYPKTIVLDIYLDELTEQILQPYKYEVHDGRVYIYAKNVAEVLGVLLQRFSEYAIAVDNINIHEANLEDVFMEMTNSKF